MRRREFVAALGAVATAAHAQTVNSTSAKYGPPETMRDAGELRSGGVDFESVLIHKELHDKLEKSVGQALDQCAATGCPNMITVGGKRKGISYKEGAENCAAFFNRVKSHAEDKGGTICLEV